MKPEYLKKYRYGKPWELGERTYYGNPSGSIYPGRSRTEENLTNTVSLGEQLVEGIIFDPFF